MFNPISSAFSFHKGSSQSLNIVILTQGKYENINLGERIPQWYRLAVIL